jgi:hypothetical protein
MTSAAQEISNIIKRRTIPRLDNCGVHIAQDNKGQWYYLNHADTWQTYQGPHIGHDDSAYHGVPKKDA